MARLLMDGLALMHPFFCGELACGRATAINDLNALPRAHRASDAEVMYLIDARQLQGKGLGWIDAHLLASALVSGCRLWTLDKRLRSAASELGLGFEPEGH